MEVEAGANEGRGGVGKTGGIGVALGRGMGVAAESVERGLDAEATLAATTFGRGFLGGGEGEGAAGKKVGAGVWMWVVE